MKTSLLLGALVALGCSLAGCGMGWIVSVPECQWVAIADVDGTWVSEPYEGQAIGPLGELDRRTWVLEQAESGLVSGLYTETYLDGASWSDDLTGSHDTGAGLLVLEFDSPIWGADTRFYRFVSEFEMYEAASDPNDSFCMRPIHRQL